MVEYEAMANREYWKDMRDEWSSAVDVDENEWVVRGDRRESVESVGCGGRRQMMKVD